MQKATLIFLVTIVAVAICVPIFADVIPNITANDTNNTTLNDTNSTNNTGNDTIGNNSTNSTLTSGQLQTLTDTQTKLTALIATIEGLKATYGNNTKAKGLLNALDQFEKQANKLNSEITAFIQNPTVNGTDGMINSFVKREAALEHKVAIKQALLAKMSTKVAKINKVKTLKKDQKQNKGHNK